MTSESSAHLCASKPRHMQPATTPRMTLENAHLDIPGNSPTAKSNIQRLNDRPSGAPMKEFTNTGMMEVYNHQYLWDNRQTPKVYEAFCDIWGTDKRWVTTDRANLSYRCGRVMNIKGLSTGIMIRKRSR